MANVTIEPRTPKHDAPRIVLRASFREKDICKSITGRWWEPTMKAWTYPASPTTAREIALCFPRLDTTAAFDDLVAQAERAEAARHADDGDADLLQPRVIRTQPWKHQLVGGTLIRDQPGTLLHWSMGTGKTLTVVMAVIELELDPVLIVCPCSVLGVWAREFEKHAPGRASTCVLSTARSVANRRRDAERFLDMNHGGLPRVLVINYESVWRKAFAEFVMQHRWGAIICDEGHRIKAPGSKVSMFMHRAGRQAKRRVVLTGTPLGNGPLDAYGQFRFLDDGVFGTSFTRFRATYAIVEQDRRRNYPIIRGYQNITEFNRRFYSIAHRVNKEDVLDLPDAVHETRTFELNAKARRIYNGLCRDLVADYQGGVITAANAMVLLLRLQQVTSGFAVIEPDDDDDGKQETIPVDDGKQKMLEDLLEDLPPKEPLVVLCIFRHDLDAVHAAAEATGRKSLEISGRRKDVGAIWEDGPETVCAVQIQAGGVGIDLTRACYCALYSTGFNRIWYEQALARVHRHGQERSVTYIHLHGAGTVDEYVYETLGKKTDLVEACLERLAE